jgi:sugar phosphate permease
MRGTRDVGTLAFWGLLLTLFGNAGYAPLVIFLNERFPTALRSTGTGLSWNIGFAIGGMMPTFVSFFSASPDDLPNMLAIFTFGISVLFLAGALIIPETKGNLR